MIPPEAILEASATMIIGILFVVTIGQIMGKRRVATTLMFWFCCVGILPFSISAILALLELTEYAKWVCIGGFISFAFWLTLLVWILREVAIEEEEE